MAPPGCTRWVYQGAPGGRSRSPRPSPPPGAGGGLGGSTRVKGSARTPTPSFARKAGKFARANFPRARECRSRRP